MPEKRHLFAPGPTPVPPEVLAAIAQPIIHHRGPDFRAVYQQCLDRLREVFRTESDLLLLTSSGTGAMESAVANLCSPGDRVVAVSAGYFGERFASIASAFGCDVDHLRYDWGEAPSADDLAARLRELGGAHAVLLTQSETSTGVVADVAALTAAAKKAGSPDDDTSAIVTAVRVPDGIDSDELALTLRDRYGITLAPGQGPLKGKVFRIGHIGYYDIFDITTALAAIELTLAEAGADIERGQAVTRALETFEESARV